MSPKSNVGGAWRALLDVFHQVHVGMIGRWDIVGACRFSELLHSINLALKRTQQQSRRRRGGEEEEERRRGEDKQHTVAVVGNNTATIEGCTIAGTYNGTTHVCMNILLYAASPCQRTDLSRTDASKTHKPHRRDEPPLHFLPFFLLSSLLLFCE